MYRPVSGHMDKDIGNRKFDPRVWRPERYFSGSLVVRGRGKKEKVKPGTRHRKTDVSAVYYYLFLVALGL